MLVIKISIEPPIPTVALISDSHTKKKAPATKRQVFIIIINTLGNWD